VGGDAVEVIASDVADRPLEQEPGHERSLSYRVGGAGKIARPA
jgi:hypothetical protein